MRTIFVILSFVLLCGISFGAYRHHHYRHHVVVVHHYVRHHHYYRHRHHSHSLIHVHIG